HVGFDAHVAQVRDQPDGLVFQFGRAGKVDDEGAGLLLWRRRDVLPLHFENDAFHARAEANAWRGAAAKNFGQPVVAPAAAQRQLIIGGGELEDGARIVIQAAHEQRVEREGNLGQRQVVLQGGEVFAAWLAEVIGDFWRGGDLRL